MALTNAGVDAIFAEIVADYDNIASITRTGDVSTLADSTRAFLATVVFEDTFAYKTRDVDVTVMLCEGQHFKTTDTSRLALKAAIALAAYKQYRFNGVPSILNLVDNTTIVPTTKALTVGAMSNAVDTLNDLWVVSSSYWTQNPTVGVLLVEEFLTGATNRLFTRIDTILKQGFGEGFQAAILADPNGTYPQIDVDFYDLTDGFGNLQSYGDGSGSVTSLGQTHPKTVWLARVRKAFLSLSKLGGYSSYQ